jgi:hypothetical protein
MGLSSYRERLEHLVRHRNPQIRHRYTLVARPRRSCAPPQPTYPPPQPTYSPPLHAGCVRGITNVPFATATH